jgi:hypothetical protein
MIAHDDHALSLILRNNKPSQRTRSSQAAKPAHRQLADRGHTPEPAQAHDTTEIIGMQRLHLGQDGCAHGLISVTRAEIVLKMRLLTTFR